MQRKVGLTRVRLRVCVEQIRPGRPHFLIPKCGLPTLVKSVMRSRHTVAPSGRSCTGTRYTQRKGQNTRENETDGLEVSPELHGWIYIESKY